MEERPSGPTNEVAAVAAPPAEPRRRRWGGAIGMTVAIALAFIWGGIADRQFSGRAAARVITVPAAAAAVKGAEAPPQWIGEFASAFCSGDAKTIAPRIGPPLTNNVDAIANALSDRDWECSDIRFAGGGQNPKGLFYVFISRNAQQGEQWWVFTVIGDQVVAID
jgi:hypothetical protein